MYVYNTEKGQKRVLGPLKLGFQAIHAAMWVLGKNGWPEKILIK